MEEKTVITIIEILVKALEGEKLMREYYEKKVKELEEKGEQKIG